MRKWWNRFERWCEHWNWDKLSQLVYRRKPWRIKGILKEVKADTHRRVDECWDEIFTPEVIKQIAKCDDKVIIRQVMDKYIKETKTKIQLPLKANLEDVKVKKK